MIIIEINEKEEEKKKETQIKEENVKNEEDENITIFPWTDFKEEFLSKIEYNKKLRHQKWEECTSKIIDCYYFNGLIFEIVDKNIIEKIIIY